MTAVVAGAIFSGWDPTPRRVMISRRVFLFGASALCISLSERSVAWAGRTLPHPTLPHFAFEPEAVSIINAMTAAGAAPSANRQYFINRTVKRIKNIGAW